MGESPVEEEVPPAEAFAALADPVRVAVLEALWTADDHTATFSELRTAVGVADSGRFNYHLSKLRDRFVTKEEGGYRLRLAGSRVVGALLSGAYTQTGSVESMAMEQACPFCGDTMTLHYENERVSISCVDCDTTSVNIGIPPGVFAGYDRESLPDVTERYARTAVQRANGGFCMTCEGRIDPHVTIEMPPDDADDWPEVPLAEYECERCGDLISSDLGTALLDHPDVVAFYHDHDVDVREASLWRFVAIDGDSTRIRSADPLQVGVVYTAGDDRLTLTVDDALSVLAVE
ncbi:ArsR/SmtB family transcription factor [Halococcus agarilyticus]|uniref:ArsR/SmtB family transcription factor n=1 Tax=Halococcus agarilyticus TaxID=1232219 RepID=UPI000677F95E|nr:winged helix-turn-helix domain-containing protein [Halococcus agarilyticus]